ncbi:hypothetical protein B0H17DRAFT_1123881 [Mycena rosella]|uniref:Uncharacterized protein n=1 Tax=Mycena rosella TaxID=1033263 RepID=A0AAD7H2Q2_MYCRO|nr:hypothetical protein B0H17DRAFT_1123881 [Mycena rosella]
MLTLGGTASEQGRCRHPWPRVWEAFGDGPEKKKMSNVSFKTLNNYLCSIRRTTPEKGLEEAVGRVSRHMNNQGKVTGMGRGGSEIKNHRTKGREHQQKQSTRSDGAASRNPTR